MRLSLALVACLGFALASPMDVTILGPPDQPALDVAALSVAAPLAAPVHVPLAVPLAVPALDVATLDVDAVDRYGELGALVLASADASRADRLASSPAVPLPASTTLPPGHPLFE